MTLHPLSNVAQGTKLRDSFYALLNAERWLEWLLADQFIPLGVARPACQTLLDSIKKLLEPALRETPDFEAEIDFLGAYNLKNNLQAFETVYAAELQALDTYFVVQKLAYVTHDLIENADKVLPVNIVAVIEPQALDDLRQAGRCLLIIRLLQQTPMH